MAKKKVVKKEEVVTKTRKSPEKKEVFYVGIEDASDLRKEVLSSAKGIIFSLRKFEQIKENRRQKIVEFSNLKTIIKEINVLNNKLKTLMPETKIRNIAFPKKSRLNRPKPMAKKIEKKPKKPASEIDKLERELLMIENKLKRI